VQNLARTGERNEKRDKPNRSDEFASVTTGGRRRRRMVEEEEQLT
jgi:hypothetical protein